VSTHYGTPIDTCTACAAAYSIPDARCNEHGFTRSATMRREWLETALTAAREEAARHAAGAEDYREQIAAVKAQLGLLAGGLGRSLAEELCHQFTMLLAERDAARREAEEARGLLTTAESLVSEVQWCDSINYGNTAACPSCRNGRGQGHLKDGCELADFLADTSAHLARGAGGEGAPWDREVAEARQGEGTGPKCVIRDCAGPGVLSMRCRPHYDRLAAGLEPEGEDTSLDPAPPSPAAADATHRCKVCGALWHRWPAGTWSLRSATCGACCDKAPMGEQIEALAAPAAACERCGHPLSEHRWGRCLVGITGPNTGCDCTGKAAPRTEGT
jgi:hypothetical protein